MVMRVSDLLALAHVSINLSMVNAHPGMMEQPTCGWMRTPAQILVVPLILVSPRNQLL